MSYSALSDGNLPGTSHSIKYKTPWNKLPLDLQYKVVLELEDGIKTQTQICKENDIGVTTAAKIRKNAEQIKLNIRKGLGKLSVEKKVTKVKASLTPSPGGKLSVEKKVTKVKASLTPSPGGKLSVEKKVIEVKESLTPSPARKLSEEKKVTEVKASLTPSPAKKLSEEKKVTEVKASLTPSPANILGSKSNSSKNATQSSIGIATKKGEQQNKNPKKTETSGIYKSTHVEHKQGGPETTLRPSGKTADWDEYLLNGNNMYCIPPVSMFKHAPLANIWKEYAVTGRVFEVANPFIRCVTPVNWFARVIHFAGYKALIEFESLDMMPKYIAWMSYCSALPKPIGYSEKNGIVLHPPDEIRAKYPDFLMRARKAIWNSSAVTISNNHGEETLAEIKKCQKYNLKTVLEVMDKLDISRMQLATVTALIGDRIHVTYLTKPKPNDCGFWFNVNSELIHPLGWSHTVGHELYGVPKSTKFLELSLDHFPKYPDTIKLEKGQLLEVRHPLQPSKICAAVVLNALKYGYFVVEIRIMSWEVRIPTKFVFHVTSPYVFYCGFAQQHGIKIIPPFGESLKKFNWDDYIRRFNLTKAPLHLLPKRPPHHFKPGMKMEGIDIADPIYLGPCTVLKVAGHLLYVHFDGWKKDSKFDHAEVWFDAESPDIYPIGFAEMVGHEFVGCVELFNESVDPADMSWLYNDTESVTNETNIDINIEEKKDRITEESDTQCVL